MAVDLNSIPAAAIQRVEVITGGASSVYGADAVAGVVNFILKQDFEGIDVDLQTGAMQNGEGAETRASVLFGVNSADGRGNIMLGIELAKREPMHADDTDFYHNALRDGTVEGTELIYTGPYYRSTAANAPNGAVIDGIFNQQAAPGIVLRDAPPRRWPAASIGTTTARVYTGGEIIQRRGPRRHRLQRRATYRYNGPTYTSRERRGYRGRLSVPQGRRGRGRSRSSCCSTRQTFRSIGTRCSAEPSTS